MVVVESQHFKVVHAVAESAVLKSSGFESGSGRRFVIIEREPVEFGAQCCLKFQMWVDVPYGLAVHAEQIFFGFIEVLIDIPVRIHVVGIHAVPVGIFAVGSLIGLQPFLVVGGGKGHQVFTDIGLAVAQCRTVLHVFPCIVDAEIQVYLSCRRIGAQVENVTAHVRLGNNVFIAHIRIGKANSGFSAVHTYDGGVGGGDTRAEEVGRIVGDNEERAFYAVEILQHV